MRVSAAIWGRSSRRTRPSEWGRDPQPPPGPEDDRGVGELVFDVSERVSSLVREEFELAKTEVIEKVTKLVKGSAVGAAAGVFAFLGLILFMLFFA